jgi:hypothetical protein
MDKKYYLLVTADTTGDPNIDGTHILALLPRVSVLNGVRAAAAVVDDAFIEVEKQKASDTDFKHVAIRCNRAFALETGSGEDGDTPDLESMTPNGFVVMSEREANDLLDKIPAGMQEELNVCEFHVDRSAVAVTGHPEDDVEANYSSEDQVTLVDLKRAVDLVEKVS